MSHSSKWVWYMDAEAKKFFAIDKQSLGTRNVRLIWEWPVHQASSVYSGTESQHHQRNQSDNQGDAQECDEKLPEETWGVPSTQQVLLGARH